MNYFTLLPKPKIQEIVQLHFENPEQHLGQRTIAQEVTELVHGLEIKTRVDTMIKVLYDQDFEQITPKAIQEAFENDQRLVTVPKSFLEFGLVDLLTKTNVFASKCIIFVNVASVRKAIQGKSVVINKQKILDPTQTWTNLLYHQQLLFVRIGKSNYKILLFT